LDFKRNQINKITKTTQKDTKRHKKIHKYLKSDKIFTKRHKNNKKYLKIILFIVEN
jgi:hypothetical protein